MSLHAIVYVSDARDLLRPADLDRLLADATAFNRVAGVTGVLMFDGRRFLQFLEGPEDGIASVYPRVANARSHSGLHLLCEGTIARRAFPRWTMGTRQIDAEVLSQIIDSPWSGFAGPPAPASDGFMRLLAAWTGADGELEPPAVALGS